MNKQANIQKAISLMKSKGMSAEQALKAVYPDWDEAQIKKAAMTIRTMDKTAAVMQVSQAMVELEKVSWKVHRRTPEQMKRLKDELWKKLVYDMKSSPLRETISSQKGRIAALEAKSKGNTLKGLLAGTGLGVGGAVAASKLKKGKEKKASVGVSLTGLKYASNAMYASHIEKKAGLTKEAFLGPSVGQWAARGAGLGGLAGGGAEIMRLLRMASPAGREAAEQASKNLATAQGTGNVKRMLPFQKADATKGQVGFMNNASKDKEFLTKFDELQAAGGFKKNPTEYLKLFAPRVLSSAGVGAGAGAALGAGGAKIGQGIAKRRMIDTAKKVAVPAALGLGGLAVLS